MSSNTLAFLTEKGVINASQQAQIEKTLSTEPITTEAALLAYGLDPLRILTVFGEYYKLPTKKLSPEEKISSEVLQYIPEESARHYRILPIEVKDGVLHVGLVDPDDLDAVDALNFISVKAQKPYLLVVILESDLERGLAMYANITGEVNQALTSLETELTEDIAEKERQQKEEKSQTGEYIKEDAPVTKIVATILRYAVDGRASDIHIEPTQDKVRVRFRVDGVLIKSLELPIKVHAAVIARVKILATIRLDEKRKPQDGRFSATIDGHRIDFRVSTLPTYYGEKVVMRILDPEHGVRDLSSVGISDYNLEIIRRALKQPYGIILISGPTGSGKSTTLYGMLDEVDKAGRNVISLEDPVEYNIDGVSQSQVRPEIGYTFAAGLRSILRQDPDIIMVGEIRDKETAQLAIQAALTGHLVLSTIHTNTAIGVLPRLKDMGVDPYLIAPTLLIAMAQRLVRRICPGSGSETPIEGATKMFIDAQFADLPQEFRSRIPQSKSVLHIEPSPECPNGTRGRMAVMEAVEITPEIESLILNDGSEADIYTVARKNGFMSMKEDAIIKAMEHHIPFEEVNSLGGNFADPEATSEADTDAKMDTTPPTVDNVLQVNKVEEV